MQSIISKLLESLFNLRQLNRISESKFSTANVAVQKIKSFKKLIQNKQDKKILLIFLSNLDVLKQKNDEGELSTFHPLPFTVKLQKKMRAFYDVEFFM